MTNPLTWLNAKDDDRKRVIEEAADQLLFDYRRQWSNYIPIELHRLAYSLDAEIFPVKEFKEGARLIPVRKGFRVLVCADYKRGKFRTSIAHELVHTLFYSREGDIPRRLVLSNEKEEHFCYDVARRILAPKWHLEILRIRNMKDVTEIFKTLTERLKLSRTVAGRVMLADYDLACGVGGRWIKDNGKWILEGGGGSASPSLSPQQRKKLWNVALQWLESNRQINVSCNVIGIYESLGRSAFILITLPQHTTEKSFLLS
jgi:hypothetical protein